MPHGGVEGRVVPVIGAAVERRVCDIEPGRRGRFDNHARVGAVCGNRKLAILNAQIRSRRRHRDRVLRELTADERASLNPKVCSTRVDKPGADARGRRREVKVVYLDVGGRHLNQIHRSVACERRGRAPRAQSEELHAGFGQDDGRGQRFRVARLQDDDIAVRRRGVRHGLRQGRQGQLIGAWVCVVTGARVDPVDDAGGD